MTFTGAWKTLCRPLEGTCSCQVPPLGSPGPRRAPRRLPSAGLNDDGLHKHEADLGASGRREEGKPPRRAPAARHPHAQLCTGHGADRVPEYGPRAAINSAPAELPPNLFSVKPKGTFISLVYISSLIQTGTGVTTLLIGML